MQTLANLILGYFKFCQEKSFEILHPYKYIHINKYNFSEYQESIKVCVVLQILLYESNVVTDNLWVMQYVLEH